MEFDVKRVPSKIVIPPNVVVVVAGVRGAGKSVLTEKYLLKYGGQYDYIYIMCPSVRFNKNYKSIEGALGDRVIVQFFPYPSNDIVEQILRNQEDNADEVQINNERRLRRSYRSRGKNVFLDPELRVPHTLLIMDDCIDSGVLNYFGFADALAQRGRHINLSLWVDTQQISALSTGVRRQADFFITFEPENFAEFERYSEELMPTLHRKWFQANLDDLLTEDYQFIIKIARRLRTNPKHRFGISTTDKFIQGKYEAFEFNKKSRKRNDSEIAEETENKRIKV